MFEDKKQKLCAAFYMIGFEPFTKWKDLGMMAQVTVTVKS
jgi:hypothetical protein